MLLGKAVLSFHCLVCISLQAASCLLPASLYGYTSKGRMSLLLFQQHIPVLRDAAQRCHLLLAWSRPAAAAS